MPVLVEKKNGKPHERKVLTVEEACIELNWSNGTFYKRIDELDTYMDGRCRRVIAASVDALIASRRAGARDANGKTILDKRLDGCRGAEGRAKKAARLKAAKPKDDDAPSPDTGA